MTEHAPQGSLDRLIQRLDEDDATIPFLSKHTMLEQAASGVKALAAEKLVHRDLSTQNIQVFGFDADDASKTVVKVSGYATNARRAQRIRHFAPETIQKGSFFEKTDVWSFGVLA